ncbi:hypothetical protein CGMCC3_g6748 [Colletotrichum fructicola]|nr:uncharacterized protein CGMCC3_g6748 [Colletotrichum fructicola]KAE9577272.1 hypothetical protein CGMCC3_g6748 [Colletotrichum fructicola]KAF5490184.1 SAGA-associated factor 73 [Colletotrichum fructicola]
MMRSAHPEGIVVASGANVPLGEPAGPGQMHSGRRRRGHGRGPVDIERQCGVAYPNGRMCGAALTCRRHSMGAKRAVAGRSAPFDALLPALLEQRCQ